MNKLTIVFRREENAEKRMREIRGDVVVLFKSKKRICRRRHRNPDRERENDI